MYFNTGQVVAEFTGNTLDAVNCIEDISKVYGLALVLWEKEAFEKFEKSND